MCSQLCITAHPTLAKHPTRAGTIDRWIASLRLNAKADTMHAVVWAYPLIITSEVDTASSAFNPAVSADEDITTAGLCLRNTDTVSSQPNTQVRPSAAVEQLVAQLFIAAASSAATSSDGETC